MRLPGPVDIWLAEANEEADRRALISMLIMFFGFEARDFR